MVYAFLTGLMLIGSGIYAHNELATMFGFVIWTIAFCTKDIIKSINNRD